MLLSSMLCVLYLLCQGGNKGAETAVCEHTGVATDSISNGSGRQEIVWDCVGSFMLPSKTLKVSFWDSNLVWVG